MESVVLWLQGHIHQHSLLYFIALYIAGGKPLALLTAKLCGLELRKFLALTIFMDTLQVPAFYYLYEHTLTSTRLSAVGARFQRRSILAQNGRLFQVLKTLGSLGVLLITMAPVKGGGIWTGVLLAHLTGLSKRISFPVLIGGSALSALMIVGLYDVLAHMWQMLAG